MRNLKGDNLVVVLCVQENRYEEACNKFTTAMQILGYKPDLSYNIALCHYMMRQYAPALKHIADIIERGIREHPGIKGL
jgi:tetratricopeptide repeat protein 30